MMRTIRDNVVVLITPVLEVDGRDRVVDLYNNYHVANPGKSLPGAVYWGHYVAHDNNRDGIGQHRKRRLALLSDQRQCRAYACDAAFSPAGRAAASELGLRVSGTSTDPSVARRTPRGLPMPDMAPTITRRLLHILRDSVVYGSSP
jgi:hypothetical protein